MLSITTSQRFTQIIRYLGENLQSGGASKPFFDLYSGEERLNKRLAWDEAAATAHSTQNDVAATTSSNPSCTICIRQYVSMYVAELRCERIVPRS